MHYQASQAHDTWDFLPSIQTPTLLIHGSEDEINPCANSELIARRIPGANLYVLKGARHCYFEEFRDVASQIVCNFLLSHSIVRS
jgi:pimeloyl-ACP methyl ester carboxylesterase